MPTVANLLSKPMFKDFRMVSGKSGLNNKVTSAGFLEWEQDTQITNSFDKGEFVLTTLASIKDDSVAIDRSLKLLINNHVSAIAIKDIYFTDLPDTIKDYSNEHGVPIMFFTDTYIDEILYAIKNETLNSLYTSFNEIVLDTLISNDNLDVLEKENLLTQCSSTYKRLQATGSYCKGFFSQQDTSLGFISLSPYKTIFSLSCFLFRKTFTVCLQSKSRKPRTQISAARKRFILERSAFSALSHAFS